MGLCIVLLLFCSALMSGSEAAFFSLSPKETQTLKDNEDNGSKRVIRLLSTPNRLLGIILQANNLVNILIVMLSNALMSRLFDFSGHPVLEFVICTVVVTFLLVLFGEAIPKLVGTKNPVSFARMTSRSLSILKNFTIPADGLIEKIVDKFKINKGNTEEDGEDAYKYLNGAVEMAIPEDPKRKQFLKRVLDLPKKNVAQIMKPRVDVVTLEMSMSNDEVIEIASKCGYSRLPVFKDNLDDIRGFLYIKDMLPYIVNKAEQKNSGHENGEKRVFDWRHHIREAYFVPGSMKIVDLLEQFRAKKLHLAIVVDEYGGMDGIVTLEDILEEIIGDITDESDKSEAAIEAALESVKKNK